MNDYVFWGLVIVGILFLLWVLAKFGILESVGDALEDFDFGDD